MISRKIKISLIFLLRKKVDLTLNLGIVWTRYSVLNTQTSETRLHNSVPLSDVMTSGHLNCVKVPMCSLATVVTFLSGSGHGMKKSQKVRKYLFPWDSISHKKKDHMALLVLPHLVVLMTGVFHLHVTAGSPAKQLFRKISSVFKKVV